MRIGIDAQLLRGNFAGVQYCIHDLIEHLATVDQQNDYFIYINRSAALLSTNVAPNFSFRESNAPGHGRLARVLWQQTVLPYLLARDRVDVFHAPAYVMPLLSGRPTVVTIPDVIALRHPEMCRTMNQLHFRFMLPATVARATRIITVSEASKRDIMRAFAVSEQRIDVVANGVHGMFVRVTDVARLDRVRKRYRLPNHFILFVGNIEPKKNVERIVQAFALLRHRDGIRHGLVIVGQDAWSFRPVYEWIDRLGLKAEIVLTGYVPRTELPCLYSMADVMVFPSLYEGFGVPPIEAMGCGTPVVTSSTPACAEVAGDAAIQVDPLDVESIADGILKVFSNRRRTAGRVAAGLTRARAFSWDSAARRTVAVYSKVFAG